jgi:hypothetical protein
MNQRGALYPTEPPAPRLIAEWEARARWSGDLSRIRREAERTERKRRARQRRDELVAGAIAFVCLVFIALALFCGPASAL